jgi:hypothetical protein
MGIKYHPDSRNFALLLILLPALIFSSPLHGGNFDVNGVKKGIDEVSKVYRLLNAAGNLQASYPESGHDFPPEVRLEAYRFLDKILKHHPSVDKIE